MFNIRVANSSQRTDVTMKGEETIREAWERVFGEYNGEGFMLNGVTVKDVDVKFEDLGLDEERSHFLSKIAKVENA